VYFRCDSAEFVTLGWGRFLHGVTTLGQRVQTNWRCLIRAMQYVIIQAVFRIPISFLTNGIWLAAGDLVCVEFTSFGASNCCLRGWARVGRLTGVAVAGCAYCPLSPRA